MKILLFSIYCLLFVACNLNNTEDDLLNQVKKGQEKWQNQHTQNYEYVYQKLCFCAFTDDMLVVVKSDSVVQILNSETREPFMVQEGDEELLIIEAYPELFLTITEFYIEWREIMPSAYQVVFKWDEATGLPLEVYIDRNENVADDESTYKFSSLKKY